MTNTIYNLLSLLFLALRIISMKILNTICSALVLLFSYQIQLYLKNDKASRPSSSAAFVYY